MVGALNLPFYQRTFFSAVGDSAFKKKCQLRRKKFWGGDCLIFNSIGLGTFLRIFIFYSPSKLFLLGLKKILLCRRQRLKLLSAVCDSIYKIFAMSATALESTKWRVSNLNHKNLEFFGLVPKSSHTGQICVKSRSRISHACGPLQYMQKRKKGCNCVQCVQYTFNTRLTFRNVFCHFLLYFRWKNLTQTTCYRVRFSLPHTIK